MRALSLLLLTACTGSLQGTDTGNAYTVGVIGEQSARRAASAPTLTAAFIVLEDIRIEPCEGERDRADFDGPYSIDLLAGELLGEAEFSGEPCGLRMDIDDDEALGGLSILLEGATGAGTDFEIRSELSERLRVDDSLGLFSDGEPDGMLLMFDLSGWLAGLDIDGVGGGEISEDANEALLERFEENIEQSAELLRDSDGDLIAD